MMLECSMQNDPVVSKASELLRLGLMPSVEEIKAGKVCIMFLGWFTTCLIIYNFVTGFIIDRCQFVQFYKESCFVDLVKFQMVDKKWNFMY